MSFDDWLDRNFGKKAEALAKDNKFFQESSVRALWEIKNLLEKLFPPIDEKRDYLVLPGILLDPILIRYYRLEMPYNGYLYFNSQAAAPPYTTVDVYDISSFNGITGRIIQNLRFQEFCYLNKGFYILQSNSADTFGFILSPNPFFPNKVFQFDNEEKLRVAASLVAGGNDVNVLSIAAGSNIIGATKIDKINYVPVSKWLQATAAGDTTVWDPTAGTKFRLLCLIFSNYGTADKTIYFKDGANQFTPSFKISAGQIAGVPLVNCGYFSGTADNNLVVNLSATGSIGVWALGYEE